MTRDSIKIYDALKGDIIRLKYKPGTRFGEVEIARKYQVSRTPDKRCPEASGMRRPCRSTFPERDFRLESG
jgi:hypothetical protein